MNPTGCSTKAPKDGELTREPLAVGSSCEDYFAADVGHVRHRDSVVGSRSWVSGSEKGGNAEVGRRRRGEEAGDEMGTEQNSMSDWGAIRLPNYVHRYVLYTLGLEAPMWYIQGRTVAVHTVGLGTWNSELRVRDSEFLSVVRSMADGLQETCGAL